jgi:bifunctional oligoribonuclease and PAP phosphatase NrnA
MDLIVPEKIIALVSKCIRAAILVHEDPDADALGSAIALQRTLRSQNKTATIFYSGDISPKLQILFSVDDLVQEVTPRSLNLFESSNLIIICDTREPSRLGDWYEPLQKVMAHIDILSIDHHVGKPPFNYVWSDPSFSSTSEMMTCLIQKLNWKISSDIAICLAAGIMSDTGNFTNTNSTSTALETVAYLVQQGANLNRISLILNSSGSFTAAKLRGEAISRAQADFDGKYVWTAISHDMFERYKTNESDLEGLGSYLRAIDGVQISAVFYEQTPQQTRVSLRSNDRYDVQSIASQYSGGGGHKQAAGCIVQLDPGGTQIAIAERVQALLIGTGHD